MRRLISQANHSFNFNNFQCNEINNALNRFLTNVFAQWNDVRTFKAKTKKCKPSLGPGVKTVWRRLQSSNKNIDPVSGQSRHQTTHQALTCSMTAQQHKNNSDTTVLSLSKQMPVLTKHQPEHNDRRNETSDNQSVIYSLKDATTTWEKRSKDCLPDVMETSLSRKTSAEQQTTYCFVNLSGCVQW